MKCQIPEIVATSDAGHWICRCGYKLRAGTKAGQLIHTTKKLR